MIIGQGITIGGGIYVDSQIPSYSIVTTNLFANYDAATGISGSTFLDSSGNSRNATLFGSPTTTTDNGTTVLRLTSSSSQYFGRTTGYGTSLDSAFTYDVWCRNLSAATDGSLISEWNDNTFNSGWTDNNMGFTSTAINCGVYNSGYATAKTGWSNSSWYNIVMTYNSSVGMKTFVNATAGGVTVGARTLPASTFLSMGKPSNFDYLNGVTQYFNGYIGAWKIYSRALTVEEITQNYNALRGRYGL
jgi:hypothetical protein